jgi:hypothetical protein
VRKTLVSLVLVLVRNAARMRSPELASPRPSAPPSCASSPSPDRPSWCPRSVVRVVRFVPMPSALKTRAPWLESVRARRSSAGRRRSPALPPPLSRLRVATAARSRSCGADSFRVDSTAPHTGQPSLVLLVLHKIPSVLWFHKYTVTPAFLAPNKSPTKSRVFSKPFRRAHLPPFSKPDRSLSLSPSASVPRIPPAPPAPGPSPVACRPSTVVGHHAGNPAHVAVPPAGPPCHHRRPGINAGI